MTEAKSAKRLNYEFNKLCGIVLKEHVTPVKHYMDFKTLPVYLRKNEVLLTEKKNI